MAESGTSDIEQNKALAAIGYLGILFLVPLLAAPKSPFAQFHAKQGMALFIAEVIVSVAWWVLVFIPWVGWLIGWVAWIGIIVLTIVGIVNAAQGQTKPLPVIGGFVKSK